MQGDYAGVRAGLAAHSIVIELPVKKASFPLRVSSGIAPKAASVLFGKLCVI
ncbi:MAG: hypothetical protein QMD09_06560 [Desulfatibacillaceae bacterium]|nr:hypothetical protein [Desulfatibacillaceae bacterium]